jgi:hypothetical protein
MGRSIRDRGALAVALSLAAAALPLSAGRAPAAAASLPPAWSLLPNSGAPPYGAIPEGFSCSGCGDIGSGPSVIDEEYQTGALATDPRDHTVLAYTQDSPCQFFFGVGGCSDVATTYSFTGSKWVLLRTDSRSEQATIAAVTTSQDALGAVRVEPCGAVECLYRWTGSAWELQHPATSPPHRDYANVAFNDRTGWMVLFGGWSNDCLCYLTDTWTWDGSTWSQAAAGAHPGAVLYQSMARDPLAGMVLYDARTRQTWRHDGSGWHQLQPAHVPPAAAPGHCSLTFDRASGQVVMLVASTVTSTWTWDGVDWTSRAVGDATSPGPAPSAVDPRTGRTVSIAGSTTYVWGPLLG